MNFDQFSSILHRFRLITVLCNNCICVFFFSFSIVFEISFHLMFNFALFLKHWKFVILGHIGYFCPFLAKKDQLGPIFFSKFEFCALSASILCAGWVVSFIFKSDHFLRNCRFLVRSLVNTLCPKGKICTQGSTGIFESGWKNEVIRGHLAICTIGDCLPV